MVLIQKKKGFSWFQDDPAIVLVIPVESKRNYILLREFYWYINF